MAAPSASQAENLAAAEATQGRIHATIERGRSLAATISSLQAQLAEVAAEVDELDGFYAGMTPAAFLSWQWHLTPAESARTLRLSRRLGDLPGLRAALAAGRLSEGVVDLLTSVATPDNEDVLLMTAEHATGAQLQALVRDFRRGLEPDDPRIRPESYTERTGEDGMVDIHLRLTPGARGRVAQLDAGGAGARARRPPGRAASRPARRRPPARRRRSP